MRGTYHFVQQGLIQIQNVDRKALRNSEREMVEAIEKYTDRNFLPGKCQNRMGSRPQGLRRFEVQVLRMGSSE
jgi:hypothetical protein